MREQFEKYSQQLVELVEKISAELDSPAETDVKVSSFQKDEKFTARVTCTPQFNEVMISLSNLDAKVAQVSLTLAQARKFLEEFEGAIVAVAEV